MNKMIEQQLEDKQKNPKHIGIVLDGNRRFAKRLMLQPWKGHELGYEKIEKLFDWCKELGIKQLTLYVFSVKNFNRPKKEFDYLMKLFEDAFIRAKDDDRLKDIKINFIGRIHMFSVAVQRAMKEKKKKTKDNKGHTINFAMAYGGKEEIIDSVKKLVESGKKINKENLGDCMYMNEDVDLVIRTSGEKRTSDFLPWQAHYAEWIFLDKMWPDFEKQDLIDCIQDFNNRNRRFGV